MNRTSILSILFLCGTPLLATSQKTGLDKQINDGFMPVADWFQGLIMAEVSIMGLEVPVVLILLITGALFFTLYFGFVNIRHFPTAIQVVQGKYDELEKTVPKLEPQVHQVDGDLVDTIKNEGHTGEVSHFQALATAVSGTVGLGNIAMVAVAISMGGPGVTFWMILAGILGMSTKFVECTLGVKFRDIDKNGKVFGGPMNYLSEGLRQRGMARLGKFLAVLFAIFCLGAALGGGNAFQSNQMAAQIMARFDLDGAATGSILGLAIALMAGVVIIGGIQRIAKVTEKVVPFMAILYVGGALFIIGSNYHLVDDMFSLILSDAFTPKATITGGFVGVMIQGFRRAAFSNEAGMGSAAIAHSAVNTNYPASEGLVALLEPFIDTVLVCTMTSLVIILFNMDGAFIYGNVIDGQAVLHDGRLLGGANLTSTAFEHGIAGFSWVLMAAVCLFAFSTMLSWSYYGMQSWKYLFGRSKTSDMTFKIVYLLFTVLGAAVTLDAIIKFSEAMLLAMVFPNMIGLLLLYPYVKKEYNKYMVLIGKKKVKPAS